MSSRFDDNGGRRSNDDGIFHDINDDHGGRRDDDNSFHFSDDSFLVTTKPLSLISQMGR